MIRQLADNLVKTLFSYAADTAINLTADGVYGASKMLFPSLVELAAAAGDATASLPEYLINSAAIHSTGYNPNFSIYTSTIKPIIAAHNPLPILNDLATKALAPEAYHFAQEHASMGVSTFQACDLLGPALLLAASSNRTAANAVNSLTKIKHLLTFKRSIVTEHQISGSSKLENSTVTIISHENLSTTKLLVGASLDGLFSAGWFMLGKFTRTGIIRALAEAGNAESTATNIVNAVAIATVVAPVAWKAAKSLAAYTSASAHKTQELTSVRVDGQEYSARDLADPVEREFFAKEIRWNPQTYEWEEN